VAVGYQVGHAEAGYPSPVKATHPSETQEEPSD
jgi:hypothetical protein